MKSLKERLMFWKSGKAPAVAIPTFPFHNELLIEPGAYLSLDILDYRGDSRKVTAYNEWRREVLGQTFRFTDYSFEDNRFKVEDKRLQGLKVEDKRLKVRAFDDSADKDDNIWILTLFHEQGDDEGLISALEEACKPQESPDQPRYFFVNNDDETTTNFRRFNGFEQPFLAYTYPENGKYHYWDFYNEANPDQLLYVEQNLQDGFIQMWLAQRISLANILVI